MLRPVGLEDCMIAVLLRSLQRIKIRLGVKATTLKAKAKAKDVSRPMSIWSAVQSKFQNTDVYCRAGND